MSDRGGGINHAATTVAAKDSINPYPKIRLSSGTSPFIQDD
ncbi:hypothetical protein [Sphingobium yanoikuyae]|nr:hypothetical protein [Sphingobium yanoikuyae]WBQ19028.1 hypothetical protein PAE53_24635 [Sphingobium yanoikuyae]